MRLRHLLVTALGLSLALPAVAFAQDQTQDQTRDQIQDQTKDQAKDQTRDRDLIRLKDELQKRTKLSKSDVEALTPEIEAYLEHSRDRVQLREMVRYSLREKCTGECLKKTLQTMNLALADGLTPRRAREMVVGEMRAQIREHQRTGTAASGEALAEQVRTRVEARLQAQERLRKPAGEREKAMEEQHERTREQMREHERQEQQGGQMGPGGAHQGGGQNQQGPGGGK